MSECYCGAQLTNSGTCPGCKEEPSECYCKSTDGTHSLRIPQYGGFDSK